MKRAMTVLLAAIALAAIAAPLGYAQPATSCCNSPGLAPQRQAPVFQDLAGSGKKCWIGEVNYFTWKFDKSPRMGTFVLILELYDKDGRRVSDMAVTGRSDMPALRGAHDSGDVPFMTERSGEYLLPLNVVMPGDWEVRLTFSRNGITIFWGRIAFNV